MLQAAFSVLLVIFLLPPPPFHSLFLAAAAESPPRLLLLFPSSYLWGGASLPNSTNDEGTNMQLRRVQELMFAAKRCRRHLVEPWLRVDVRNYTWFEEGGNSVQQLSPSAAQHATLGRISAPLRRFAWYVAPDGWQQTMMEEEEAHARLNGQLHALVLVSRWEHVPDGPNCRYPCITTAFLFSNPTAGKWMLRWQQGGANTSGRSPTR